MALIIAFLLLAGIAYANKLYLMMPKFRGVLITGVFNVTDNGGEAFVVTDGGGEDYNVKE